MTSGLSAVDRAIASGGRSAEPIHELVESGLSISALKHGVCVDVGCGTGDLARRLSSRFARYVGADVVRHAGFPPEVPFVEVDLDRGRVALDDGGADVVLCVETIEHVENPRALVRELTRLARPGGFVLVTTPNQLSLHSKLGIVLRNEFPHFQEAPGLYPAHITALLEIDLSRMLHEAGLRDIEVLYSGSGRIPFTARHWPNLLRRTRGPLARTFSDNVLVRGRKPLERV
jgi:SAM-dependent methyltransferase